MNKKRKITLSIAGAIIAFFALSAEGCDKGLEPYKDAPIGNRVNKNVDIIEMPDGYSNVATVCKDGVRYSTITNGGNTYGGVSVTVDPACAGK